MALLEGRLRDDCVQKQDAFSADADQDDPKRVLVRMLFVHGSSPFNSALPEQALGPGQ
jgi:hypothetical protein